ncbi:MAG: ABC transporter ATP-binding protein [Nitrosopumilus sp. D6]|nr:MAG: ABC transporter ATP-binding protein [Nitrosopumilus sp. D6]
MFEIPVITTTLMEILRVEQLCKKYTKTGLFGSKDVVRAADGVTFSVNQGEVLVIAGESGSGKSTIAKMILQSVIQDSGSIYFEGDIVDEKGKKKLQSSCQMIHQDPYDSINPRMKIGDIISEPLEIHGMGTKKERHDRTLEVLREVRLEPAEEIIKKYPHMLSGGQRQRVVLARALAPRPKMILADEPVSMLDVSVRAEMLEMFQEMQKKHDISFVYITHDLATARYFGHKIAILYLGRIVETGPMDTVLHSPRHPYTQALIDAVSEPDPANLHRQKKIRITQQDADIIHGCRFADRCPHLVDKCKTDPELEEIEKDHHTACHVNPD